MQATEVEDGMEAGQVEEMQRTKDQDEMEAEVISALLSDSDTACTEDSIPGTISSAEEDAQALFHDLDRMDGEVDINSAKDSPADTSVENMPTSARSYDDCNSIGDDSLPYLVPVPTIASPINRMVDTAARIWKWFNTVESSGIGVVLQL